MKLKLLSLLAGLGLLAAPLRAQIPATGTLGADSNYLLPQGGTAVLTVTVSGYTATTSSIGVSLTLPSGWAYASASGGPEVKPGAGDTGTLGWAYTTIPGSPASFSFAVTYPAAAGTPALTGAVILRDSGSRYDFSTTTVNFLQATAPVVTNTDPATATYGAALSFDITATSPIPITSYGATGLPGGLVVNPVTGVVSGAPTVTGGPFTFTLKATNGAGTGTKDVALTIIQATGTISLSNLKPTYDGTPKPVGVTTTPSGLTVNVLYNGSPTAPTDAGSYPIFASIADDNYTGTRTGTLVIGPAPQIISFAAIGMVKPNETVTLAASADSGLPVTFSVVKGSATVNGTNLTVTGAGDITVRATQAGDANHQSVSADQTINAAKLTQTITFAELADKMSTDAPFELTATADSGLTVSFAIISGPALLTGNTLTLTGAAGEVVVRASQAGNALYLPADNVMRTFQVTMATGSTFHGRGSRNQGNPAGHAGAREVVATGDIAAVLPAGDTSGSLLIVAPEVGISELTGFTVATDGTFALAVTQTTGDGPQIVTGTGQLLGGTLTGTFPAIGFSFAATVDPSDGPSAAAQGLYVSTALGTNSGTTYTIIGSNNEVLVLVVTPTTTVGGLATLQADGTFALQSGNLTVSGSLDAPATALSTALTIDSEQGSTTVSFGGLKNSTMRTDRLINLSGRAEVGAGENVLISGFVIGGGTPKPVLIRAVGPGLAPLGVTDPLATPNIRIVRGDGVVIAQNHGWGDNSDPDAIAVTAARVGAFALAPGSADAAFLATLAPGVYTAVVSGGAGTALAEIYDASENPAADYQRLVNISARGYVSSGNGVLIGGFVIAGNSPKRVLIRGVGPTLATQGLATPLADPVLKVFKGGTVIATNDNWDADPATAPTLAAAATATGAFALPAGSKDAAIILTLAPGVYTMHVSPVAGTTPGIALAEIYEVPE